MNECIDFIADIKVEKIFMMVSEALSQIIVPTVQDISQITFVFIFCENKARQEKWTKEWSKVKGVSTDMTLISEALKQTAQDCDQHSISISFTKSSNGTSKGNLDKLDQAVMYTLILKEILFTIDFDQEHIDKFLTYCREQFVDNTSELKNVDKIQK
jgi:hypothetical protein